MQLILAAAQIYKETLKLEAEWKSVCVCVCVRDILASSPRERSQHYMIYSTTEEPSSPPQTDTHMYTHIHKDEAFT